MTMLDMWNIIVANLAVGGISASILILSGGISGWIDYKEYPAIRKKYMKDLFHLWLIFMGISAAAWLYIGIDTCWFSK